MEKKKVEALLSQLPISFLSGLSTDLKRNHEFQEVACTSCGKIRIRVTKRCQDLLCKHCARRHTQLYKTFASLDIVPSHLMSCVLPWRPIDLENLNRGDVSDLQNALTRFRRKAFFKKKVEGGYTHIELSANWSLEVRLHAHLLIQAFQTSKSCPLDIMEADKVWHELSGQHMEAPQPLLRNTLQEASERFLYVAKSLRGERSVKILKELEDYQGKYCERAMQLRVFIIRRYNRVFRGVHKRGFFGKWYGKGTQSITQAKSTVKLEYRCPCRRAPLASAVA